MVESMSAMDSNMQRKGVGIGIEDKHNSIAGKSGHVILRDPFRPQTTDMAPTSDIGAHVGAG
jgi:hypothetical protein